MASGQVLIVSADERWLRVLEVTLRLAGAETISRRSVSAALRTPAAEGQQPTAIVVDLGAQTNPEELEDVLGLIQANSLPALVILAEGLSSERDRFVGVGATVLVRPYRPSELYAALWPGQPISFEAPAKVDAPLTVDDAPLTVDPAPAATAALAEQEVVTDDPASRGETEP